MEFKRLAKEDKTELEMGLEIEKEHSDALDFFKKVLKENDVEMPIPDDEFFEMIAKAHIREIPDYYTRLKKMEAQ